MDIQALKEHMLNNDLIETVLQEIGCHSIHNHGEYIQCANKDGDNKSAITVYLNDNLTTIDYTRQLSKQKRTTDIFDLVCYNQDCSFPESLKFVCNILGIDYYSQPQDVPESIQIIQMLKEMSLHNCEEKIEPLKPISENILNYYLPFGNKMFEEDGISLQIQKEFGIAYDPCTNRITIPIRSAIGDLCGIKGRYFGTPDEYHPKYLYIEKVAKGRILYGFFENKEYIKSNSYLYVVESEKAVLQLASIGIRNVISTGGKTISKSQIELITRTGCTPIFSYDQDVKEQELYDIANMFIDGMIIKAIIDKNHILDDKQSPSDDISKWNYLLTNNIYTIKESK